MKDTRKTAVKPNTMCQFHGCLTVKKPLIYARNLKTRIKFAIGHISWSVNDWSKVHFSDNQSLCYSVVMELGMSDIQ